MYYNTCELCGAHLDPGEDCDCAERKQENQNRILRLLASEHDGQMTLKEVLACQSS